MHDDRHPQYIGLRVLDLVQHLLVNVYDGKRKYLAADLDIKEPRTVDKWFEQGVTIQQTHRAAIVKLATDHGIEPTEFCESPRLWHFKDTVEDTYNRTFDTVADHSSLLLDHGVTLWGEQVRSRFGASASTITATPSSINWLARNGADIIVFKTVLTHGRSAIVPAHIYYADEQSNVALTPSNITVGMKLRVRMPQNSLSARNGMLKRYGLFSPEPQQWIADFRRAANVLLSGQLLVLSLSGTANESDSETDLIKDYEDCARMAIYEAGAKCIELHLSSITMRVREQFLYNQPLLACKICKAVRAVAKDVRVIAKVGYLSSEPLSSLVKAIGPFVDGIAGINAVPVTGVLTGHGGEEVLAYQPGLIAGYSGKPIQGLALDFVRQLSRIREKDSDLKHLLIFGQGGIQDGESAARMLQYADFAMAATAFLDDSYLGIKVRRHLDRDARTGSSRADQEERLMYDRFARALVEIRSTSHYSRHRKIVEAGILVLEDWITSHHALRCSPHRSTPAAVPSIERLKAMIQERSNTLPDNS
jgi:dihydroorotate dehydrogenase